MTAFLQIEMLSYWRAGTGQNRPGMLDATSQRGPDGLPEIPGKHLKGLLRDAVQRAGAFGWIEPDAEGPSVADVLFGAEGGAEAGKLRVETARLPEADRAALRGNPALTPMLFDTRRATAIGPEGTAKPGSLRFEEVAVPMTLHAPLYPLDKAPKDWAAQIEAALPLIRAIGAGRTRGLGRCIITLERRAK